MAKRKTIDDSLAELDRLPDPSSPDAAKRLRAAIESGPSLLVARAAEIVREHELRGYEPALAAAFDRFLGEDPAALDPQCRAKTAIVEALGTLEYQDAAFFLRHIGYVQIEWVWSDLPRDDGRKQGMVPVDVAAHLRGLCGYGLVQSDHRHPLPHLIDLLADPEKTTRQGAAQALALTGREEAAFILRTKLLCGDKEYEVVGECLTALLSLTPADAVPFAARFLDSPNEDIRHEAAAALGGSARPEAIAALIDRWKGESGEPFREALLLAIGAARRPEAVDFLLTLVATESPRTASQALTALTPCRFYPDLKRKIESTITTRNEPTLTKQFHRDFMD